MRFTNKVVEDDLSNLIARLNRMHREICGIDHLIHVADGIDLLFKYRRFSTVAKMRRSASSAIPIPGLIRDLMKVCQTSDCLFQDRAPFLAYKIDLLLRRHQLQGLRGTTQPGYKRYQYAQVQAQDLMVQLQEYHPLGQSTSPYPYNVVARGAPINLVQLATIYRTSPGQVRNHNFEKEIQRVARLSPTNERYIHLFPLEDCTDLTRRLGTSKYLMSALESQYEKREYWRPEVPY